MCSGRECHEMHSASTNYWINVTEDLRKGLGNKHWRPNSSFTAKEKIQDKEISPARLVDNKKREEVVRWQPMAIGQRDKRSRTSCNGRCHKEDDKESEENFGRCATEHDSRVRAISTFRQFQPTAWQTIIRLYRAGEIYRWRRLLVGANTS